MQIPEVLKNKKVLIGGGIVLLLVLGIWLWQGNIFSKEILRFEVLGPEGAKAGEEIEYTVKYKNSGNFVLENPKLTFVLPENSLTEDTRSFITQDLEDMYPGSEKFVKIKARLLGKEQDLKVAKASLSYTPKNLTARYESTTTFTTKIEEVPITLNFDLPSKVEKGKMIEYAINYFSNIDYPLENLAIKVAHPAGFSFSSATPRSLDNVEWKIASLSKAQGGRIVIRGTMNETSVENVPFVAQLGIWKNGRFIVVKQATQEISIVQPLLLLSQEVNGSADFVASPGQVLNYKISFTNIGSSPFENLFAVVRLEGDALDMSTLQAQGAQVRANDNMVIFDGAHSAALRKLGVQQSGSVNFTVKVKDNWVPANPNNSDAALVTTKVTISEISQNFSIKVNSGLNIAQEGFYQNDGIPNSGPIPPEVGKATTYTITWSIKNYSADQKNVKVRATLPATVSLTGVMLPQTETTNFSFDSASREIVWSPGNIFAGTGVTGDPVALSFQISLTPIASQKGKIAPLIGQVQISGENQFTNQVIVARDSAIDTSLPDDYAHSGGGLVK